MTPDVFLQGDPATQCFSLSRFLLQHFEATEMGQNNQTNSIFPSESYLKAIVSHDLQTGRLGKKIFVQEILPPA